MEQIVKIFVHQSYFIENDLVVDYNVEQGALANISHQDWIALIPKGWSGVDDQVAFKNVDIDCDKINLAIKSITIEKNCFQNVIECEKYYQLIYISQHFEILGRSEYFLFLHESVICNCSTKKTESKESSKKNKSSIYRRKILRRQSPTPHEFHKYRPQLQNNIENEKSKDLPINKCVKCNASTDFAVKESVQLTKIQDLTMNNEKMEENLVKLETDLTNTLEVLNKLFKLNKAISQQKDDIQKFIDDVVDGLLKDGKVTFWARDEEFSVIREFPDENQITLLPDDTSTTLPIHRSLNSLNEEHLKAIIGQQEQTIQNLVNKIKELLDIFIKVNTQSAEQHHSALTSSKNKINNIGFMDIKGTTYFSPMPYITDTLNDISLYLPNNSKNKYAIENIAINKNICNFANSEKYYTEDLNTCESKVISKLNNGVQNKPLTLENWEKYENKYTTEKCLNSPIIPEKANEFESIKLDKNYEEKCDDSL